MNIEDANKKIIFYLRRVLLFILKGSKIFWLIFLLFLISFFIAVWIYLIKPAWYAKAQNVQVYELEINKTFFDKIDNFLIQRNEIDF